MRSRFVIVHLHLALCLMSVLVAACGSTAASRSAEADSQPAPSTIPPQPDAKGCPVTPPPDPPLVPPSPWPATPPGAGEFWYGSAALWTALPSSGSWRQLALGEKFWMWSEHYAQRDVREDTTPDVTLSARRLDGSAPEFTVSEATNGFHQSFNQAMLLGVALPSPGCWQFEAEFKGAHLSFVVWIPSE